MKRLVATHAQHFLRNSALVGELVGHSNIRKRDTVLDIGAGSGAITSVLARRAGKIVAYESEPTVAQRLRKNMQRYVNVEVYENDFLEAKLPDGNYKVFANIPFHLSSRIVRKLCFAANPPRSVYLIVQKQFAQKLLIDSDHFHGALGMMIGPWWIVRIRRPLNKTDFTPPPAVDTVLLELKLREESLLPVADMQSYGIFVDRCYAEPRFYAKTSAPKDKKPSQLSLDAWVQLWSQYH